MREDASDTADDDGADSDNYAYTVGSATKTKQPSVQLLLNRMPETFLVDSGASINIIDENTYAKLKVRPNLSKAPSQLFAYGSKTAMTTLGSFKAKFETKRKLTAGLVNVANGKHGSLLSFKTASEFDIFHINVNANKCNDQPLTIDQLAMEYPQLFTKTEKLKDYQVSLHIDPSVKPVAQAHRRIPFHLQSKVEIELKALTGTRRNRSSNRSYTMNEPIVTPTKPSDRSQVRICIDFRAANAAILREDI